MMVDQEASAGFALLRCALLFRCMVMQPAVAGAIRLDSGQSPCHLRRREYHAETGMHTSSVQHVVSQLNL